MPFPSPAPFTLMRHLTPKLVCGPLDVTSLEGAWAVFNPVSAAWLGAALGSCPSFHSEGGWGHPSRLTPPHRQISAIQKISVQLDSPPLHFPPTATPSPPAFSPLAVAAAGAVEEQSEVLLLCLLSSKGRSWYASSLSPESPAPAAAGLFRHLSPACPLPRQCRACDAACTFTVFSGTAAAPHSREVP